MKNKNQKKLALIKSTVTQLSSDQTNNILGGGSPIGLAPKTPTGKYN